MHHVNSLCWQTHSCCSHLPPCHISHGVSQSFLLCQGLPVKLCQSLPLPLLLSVDLLQALRHLSLPVWLQAQLARLRQGFLQDLCVQRKLTDPGSWGHGYLRQIHREALIVSRASHMGVWVHQDDELTGFNKSRHWLHSGKCHRVTDLHVWLCAVQQLSVALLLSFCLPHPHLRLFLNLPASVLLLLQEMLRGKNIN